MLSSATAATMLFLVHCWFTVHLVNAGFYLYESDNPRNVDFDCLNYYAHDDMDDLLKIEPFPRGHQIIPFCRQDNIVDNLIAPINNIPSFTFDELRGKNVSNLQLIGWSVPVDLVERYQAFTENVDNAITSGSVRVYNCSALDRFGQFCHYTFNIKANSRLDPFREIAKELLKSSSGIQKSWTCYVHLKCERGNFLWCLNWREVCDGYIDCWNDGIDEQHCSQLEMNECQDNEYRCRNGQCIPNDFLQDNYFTPDCLDTTDENIMPSSFNGDCSSGYQKMRCDDTVCITDNRFLCNSDNNPCASTSCQDRNFQFYQALFARDLNQALTDECWARMICWTELHFHDTDPHFARSLNVSCPTRCRTPDERERCMEDLHTHCPSVFAFPTEPIAFGNLRLIYTSNQTFEKGISPEYVCYSEHICKRLSTSIELRLSTDPSVLLLCHPVSMINLHLNTWKNIHVDLLKEFLQCSVEDKDTEDLCRHKNSFRCGKKCISKHRLVDGFQDCFDNTDETFNDSCAQIDKHRQPHTSISDSVVRCYKVVFAFRNPKFPPDNTRSIGKLQAPHFPTICDGYLEFKDASDTDETNCSQWPCDNQYTRCDFVWNCPNGQDEARCSYSPCKIDEHPCLSLNTTEIICLPLNRAGDGHVDCRGAADERHLCRALPMRDDYLCREGQPTSINNSSRTFNDSYHRQCIDVSQLCDGVTHCLAYGDDEDTSMCSTSVYHIPKYCDGFLTMVSPRVTSSDILCTLNDQIKRRMWFYRSYFVPHFSLSNTSVHPPDPSLELLPSPVRLFSSSDSYQRIKQQIIQSSSHCHNGLLVYLARNDLTRTTIEGRCLCPPTTYGDRCQYQNQRVSISLQIVTPNWRILFTFVIYLIENQHKTFTIHSYHQIIYLSTRDCGTKFHFHLLYLTRPKPSESSYVVRIDVFETETLTYRASWSYPILFSFFPVYRLALQLIVPIQRIQCQLQCGEHGSCASYINSNTLFCQCESGWSGLRCQTKDNCHCSSDSLCIGSMDNINRSICVCPIHKYGPRCYLTNEFCLIQSEAKKCQNGGQCVPRNKLLSAEQNTFCTCPDRFGGDRCQYNSAQLDISLANARFSTLPDLFLLHFIAIPEPWGEHERLTTLAKLPLDQDSVTLFWKNPFNLLFAQLFNQHIYLLLIQVKYKPSVHYKLLLQPEKRCPSTRELLNSSIVGFPPLRRIKYYHLPCQQQVDLHCFHDDEQFLCLCTHDRRANCFTFDHHMNYNCRGFNYLCENGGRCFQDNITCPSMSWCACPACFFGERCQFSSRGFGSSIDDILGYQIKPLTPFGKQRTVVKVSVAVTVIMFIVGLINGVISFMTFQAVRPRQVGCGIYLRVASIISLIITIVFTLKFVILLLTQMGTIVNHVFLVIQCFSLDFLLKILVQMSDWLYACVAGERAFTAIQGVHFNKRRSRRTAKWMVLPVFLFIAGTSIHEPIHRHLLDDVVEGRRWCIIQYSMERVSLFNSYTTVMNIVHFTIPFSVNIISALIIIIIATKLRLAARKESNFGSHLRQQFREHKHLLISPIGLVLLELPRLLLHFLLDCLKSPRDSVSLFLLGYFLAFIPPILTFIVFVLPSKTYMDDFKLAFKSLRKRLGLPKSADHRVERHRPPR